MRARHIMVAIGAALTAAAGQFQFLAAGFVNPLLAKSLGVELSEVMLYNSFQAIAGVVSMTFLVPILYRRFGVRKVMVVSGVIAVVAVAAVTQVKGLTTLYLLGFLLGMVFGAATMMAASLLVNTWFERNRGAVMGAVFAFAGFGGITAGLVLPWVVTAHGWQAGFLLTAGLQLVAIVGSGIFLVRSTPEDVGLRAFGAVNEVSPVHSSEVQLPGVPARVALRSIAFWMMITGIVLFAITQAVQQHFAPMATERGVGLAAAGTLLSIMALATVFTNIFIGTLTDRRGIVSAVAVVLAAQVLAMSGYLVSSGFVQLALSTVTLALATSFWVLTPILVMQLFGPRDFGILLGPVSAAGPAGMAIGGPLWGVVKEAAGDYDPMLLASIALTFVIFFLIVVAIRSGAALRERCETTHG